MQQQPLVSVLTPSFEQARYLRDCLESVRRQTYGRIEQIVMDGGSRDGSVDLLERSSRQGLRWRSEPDRGQAHAVNKALEAAEGSIIGWLNSDDAYADRRAVAWAVEAFERDPSLDAVIGHALLVNEDNNVLQLLWTPPLSRRLLRRIHYVIQPTLFLRRSTIEREQRFLDERYHFVFDRDLLLRLSQWATFGHLGEVIAIDRHQRARKVESSAYPEEALAFDEAHGIPTGRAAKTVAKAGKIAIRLAGTLRAARSARRVDPAIELHFPSPAALVGVQLLRKRTLMSFGAD